MIREKDRGPNPTPIIKRTEQDICRKMDAVKRARGATKAQIWAEISELSGQLSKLLTVVHRKEALKVGTRAMLTRPLSVPEAGLTVPKDAVVRIVEALMSKYTVTYHVGEKLVTFQVYNSNYLNPILEK